MSTVARVPTGRKLAARPRRRYRSYALSRSATFGTGAVLPFGGWIYLGEPLHWAGLGAMMLAGLTVVPVTLLFILFMLPAMVLGGPFRQWRISYRDRQIRRGIPREQQRSSYISRSLRRLVYAADRNRCLYCRDTLREIQARGGRLEVDHGCPWRAGGLTTLVNCTALCSTCNGVKLNYWRERNGYIWYRPSQRTPERLALAAEITRVVRRKRWGLFRLWRAAWALG